MGQYAVSEINQNMNYFPIKSQSCIYPHITMVLYYQIQRYSQFSIISPICKSRVAGKDESALDTDMESIQIPDAHNVEPT